MTGQISSYATISFLAKPNDLVVIVGQSDDILAFYGSIDDEVSAWGGTTATIDVEGIRPEWCSDWYMSEAGAESYFARKKLPSMTITAVWCGSDSDDLDAPPWTISSNSDCATFTMLEDGQVFCRGIVVDLKDLRHGVNIKELSSKELSAILHEAINVIEFYADPETYFAIGLICDPPCGEFADDGSEDYDHPDMSGWRPGKRARAFLRKFGERGNDETL